jgi:hypothetical protein
VNGTDPVIIDINQLADIINTHNVDFIEMVKRDVAHEIGHEVTLGHKLGDRSFRNGPPPAPNLNDFWVAETGLISFSVGFYVPAEQMPNGEVFTLETVRGTEPASDALVSKEFMRIHGGLDPPVPIHHVQHPTAAVKITFVGNVASDLPGLILIGSHIGELMDVSLSFKEVGTIYQSYLGQDDKSKPNVLK